MYLEPHKPVAPTLGQPACCPPKSQHPLFKEPNRDYGSTEHHPSYSVSQRMPNQTRDLPQLLRLPSSFSTFSTWHHVEPLISGATWSQILIHFIEETPRLLAPSTTHKMYLVKI
jgi:hypothetical protein